MGYAKNRAIEIDEREFGESDKAVCLNCIIDVTLRDVTRAHLDEWECSFCGATADEDNDDPIAASFEEFMPLIMSAICFLYLPVAEAGLIYDEDEWHGGDVLDKQDVVYDVCGYDVTQDVLEEICDVITEYEWTDSHISSDSPDKVLRWGWHTFCEKVKHESRFVFLSINEDSTGHPDDLTAAGILAKLEQIIIDHDLVSTAPMGRVFYRGRLTDDRSKITEYRAAAALGSPPRDKASNSRMSPAGISMFYGSDDIDTVVAEIGAHSTQRYAIVGGFETMRDHNLLNLIDLPAVPSLYLESGRGQNFYDIGFLRRFAIDLAKPIVLDGREHVEYVPTQVVTEYLRFMPHFDLDGILFRSAQNNGVNCVIFCDSDGCVDPGAPPRRPFLRPEYAQLQLKPDTVQCVRIVTTVVTGSD